MFNEMKELEEYTGDVLDILEHAVKPNRLLCYSVVGSSIRGLSRAGSDVDIAGVHIAEGRSLYMGVESYVVGECNGSSIEASKFFKQLHNCAPSAIEILTSPRYVGETRLVQAIDEIFALMDTKHLIWQYAKMAFVLLANRNGKHNGVELERNQIRGLYFYLVAMWYWGEFRTGFAPHDWQQLMRGISGRVVNRNIQRLIGEAFEGWVAGKDVSGHLERLSFVLLSEFESSNLRALATSSQKYHVSVKEDIIPNRPLHDYLTKLLNEL